MLHRLWRAGLGLFALTCPMLAAEPHGGAFRGPNLPAPSPFTPGGGAAAKGGPSGTGGGLWRNSDPATWSQWWALDRDRYLRELPWLPDSSTETWTGDPLVGEAGGGPGLVQVLQETTIPELIRIVRKESDMDLLTSAVMALAKIGLEPAGADGKPAKVSTLEAIQGLLGHGNQEVAESAILALGVFGQAGAAEQLAAFVRGDTRAAGVRKISRRQRSFAAYALGVLGRQASAEAVRSFCVYHLVQELSRIDKTTPDLGVACVISLGLMPLQAGLVPAGGDAGDPPPASSREGQFAFLFELLRGKALEDEVQAYLPMAIARVAKDQPVLRDRFVAFAIAQLDPKMRQAPVVRVGIVHALGHLVTAGNAALDRSAREKLMNIARGGDRLERVLSLAALGRIGGRTSGDPLAAVPRDLLRFFMERLSKGQSYETPWAALAVGLLEYGRARSGEAPALGTLTALRHALQKAANPDEVGSLCIALGLAGDREAIPLLLKRADGGDETARGHAVTALGMLQAEEARPLLRSMALDGRRPALAREAAIALELMGDREILSHLALKAKTERFLAHQVSALLSLAYLGEQQASGPLIEVLTGRRQSETARAYAAVGLGIVTDKSPIPWNHPIAADVGWWRAPTTLLDPANGRGVVDLF